MLCVVKMPTCEGGDTRRERGVRACVCAPIPLHASVCLEDVDSAAAAAGVGVGWMVEGG